MTRPATTYKTIIEHIHHEYAVHGKPFAVWEVSDKTLVDRSTVRRLLDKLRELGYLGRTKRAFAGRFWEATSKWPDDSEEVIIKYEIYQSMKTEIE